MERKIRSHATLVKALSRGEKERTDGRRRTLKDSFKTQFFLDKHGICRHKCKLSEVFADAKVKLLCSEVRAIARVKLSLPTLPKAKLHDP